MAIARTAQNGSGNFASGASFDLAGASLLIYSWEGSQNPTATFNGVSLTKIFSIQSAWNPPTYENLYYLSSPASGSHALANSDAAAGQFIAFSGTAAGTAAIDNSASNVGSVSSVSVTPVASNCWTVVYWNATNNKALSGGPNTWISGSTNGAGLGDSEATVSGAQTQNFNNSISSNLYMITIAPLVTTSIKTWDGIVNASLKTIYGIARASVKTINGVS